MSLIKEAQDMPLFQWNKLINRDIDLDYMFTDFNENHKITQEVNDAYFSILAEIPADGKTTYEYFIKFLSQFVKYKLQKELFELKSLVFDVKDKISTMMLSESFSEYLEKLYFDNKTAIFEEYFFENLPKGFEELTNVAFFHYDNYLQFLKDNPNKVNFTNRFFLNKHLNVRKVELDIKSLDKNYLKLYTEIGELEKYFEIRAELFNINTLEFPEKSDNIKYNFEYELAVIQKVTGVRLTLRDSMLSEYCAAKKLMQEINKQEKNNHGKI